MQYLFIVNPESQSVKTKGSILKTVKAGRHAHLAVLRDFSVLPDLVTQAAEAKTKWVFIEGGDGTTHGVMTAFMRAKDSFEAFPKFSILPGGMTNQVARNIGLKRANASRVESLILGDNGQEVPFSMLKLNVLGGTVQYGFVFSSGGIPYATDYCTSKIHEKGLGGSLAVAATLARGVAGSKRVRDDMMPATYLDLRVTQLREEIHLNAEHLASIVTTLPGLMMKLDPFWGQGAGPLRLTYAKADPKKMVRNLIGIWMGNKNKDRKVDGFESFNALHLSYEYGGPVVLDGEKIDLPQNRVDVSASHPIVFVT